jgi:hypothetical protein
VAGDMLLMHVSGGMNGVYVLLAPPKKKNKIK